MAIDISRKIIIHLKNKIFLYIMDIYINVYNMHPINSYIQYVGVGAYHSAISVGDIEISFSKKKGIYYTKKNNTQEFLKESIFIDTSYLHDFEIYNKINSFDYLFNASSYDVITNNCNHFTKTITHKVSLIFSMSFQVISSFTGKLNNATC